MRGLHASMQCYLFCGARNILTGSLFRTKEMHIKSNSDYNKQYEVVADTDFAAIYIKYYDN